MQKKLPVIILLLIVLVISTGRYLHRAPKRNFADFHPCYITGEKFLKGDDVYKKDKNVADFKYPPSAALLFGFFSLLPERSAALIWHTINFFLLIGSFILSRRLLVAGKPPFVSSFALYGLVFLANLRLMLGNLDQGQVNILMMFLMLLGLVFLTEQKNIKSALAMASSAAVKYVSIILIPYFLLRKRFKLIIAMGVFMLAFLLLPISVVGPEKGLHHLKEWLPFSYVNTLEPISVTTYKNQSLLAFFNRFLWSESWHFASREGYRVNFLSLNKETVSVIFFIGCIILYLVSVFPVRGLKDNDAFSKDKFYAGLDYGLLSICIPLFNPNGWKNSFVFLLLPYMVAIYYLLKVRFKDVIAAALLLMSFALISLTSEFIVGNSVSDRFELYSSVTLGSLFLFACLARIKFGKRELCANL